MNKQEFIDRLRAALNGRIPAPQVEDTVNYYQDYINVEMRKGRSEEEVLQALGDPRLIARTIIQTNGAAGEGYSAQGAGYSDPGYQDSGYHESRYQNSCYRGAQYQDSYDDYRYNRKSFRIPGWLLGLIVILIIFVVISLIFSVLSFLAPVIIVLAALVFMVKLFRDWLN